MKKNIVFLLILIPIIWISCDGMGHQTNLVLMAPQDWQGAYIAREDAAKSAQEAVANLVEP